MFPCFDVFVLAWLMWRHLSSHWLRTYLATNRVGLTRKRSRVHDWNFNFHIGNNSYSRRRLRVCCRDASFYYYSDRSFYKWSPPFRSSIDWIRLLFSEKISSLFSLSSVDWVPLKSSKTLLALTLSRANEIIYTYIYFARMPWIEKKV